MEDKVIILIKLKELSVELRNGNGNINYRNVTENMFITSTTKCVSVCV